MPSTSISRLIGAVVLGFVAAMNGTSAAQGSTTPADFSAFRHVAKISEAGMKDGVQRGGAIDSQITQETRVMSALRVLIDQADRHGLKLGEMQRDEVLKLINEYLYLTHPGVTLVYWADPLTAKSEFYLRFVRAQTWQKRLGPVFAKWEWPDLRLLDSDIIVAAEDTSGGILNCTQANGCTTGTCTGQTVCTSQTDCTSGKCTYYSDCTKGGSCTAGPACTSGPKCTAGSGCTQSHSQGNNCTLGNTPGPPASGCTSGGGCTNGSGTGVCSSGQYCTQGSCTAGSNPGVCSSAAGCTTGKCTQNCSGVVLTQHMSPAQLMAGQGRMTSIAAVAILSCCVMGLVIPGFRRMNRKA